MAALFGPVRTLRARKLLLGAALVALVSGQASFVLVHSFTATTSVSTNTFSICTNIYNALLVTNIKRVGAIKKLLHYELPKQITHISNEAGIIKRFKISDSSAVIYEIPVSRKLQEKQNILNSAPL